MKLKNLFAITIILVSLQSSCMELIVSAEITQLALDNNDFLGVIAQKFDCKTMRNWKLTCKQFNYHTDYQHISSDTIKAEENYNMITDGLMYFADMDKTENFEKLIQNNYEQRVADIKVLGWDKLPLLKNLLEELKQGNKSSLQNFINAYKGQPGIHPTLLDYTKLPFNDLKQILQINPNMPSVDNIFPLHWACIKNETKLINLLFNNKRLNLDIRDSDNAAAIHIACLNANTKTIKLLLDNEKIDPNIQNKYDETALHIACDDKSIKKVKLLLNNEKIDPNIQNKYGETALEIASTRNSIGIVQLLLANKEIKLNIQNKYGQTTLDRACWNGYYEIANLLRAKGARHSWLYYKPYMLNISFIAILLSCCYYIISHNSTIH